MATNKLGIPSPASPKKSVHGPLSYGQNGVVTTTSRTMMLAQANTNVPYSWSLSSRKSTEKDISPSRSTRREFVGPHPTTSAAQYWAARAVTAEALLSARESHHTEIRSLSLAEDVKRKREISTLTQEHDKRHAGLERLVVALVGLLSSLVALVTYLATHHSTRQSTARQPSSHFTIPILSPFTSVVEHETSVIGSKIITVALLFVTGLAYLTLRRRISRAFG